jgi:hypothetical protein
MKYTVDRYIFKEVNHIIVFREHGECILIACLHTE